MGYLKTKTNLKKLWFLLHITHLILPLTLKKRQLHAVQTCIILFSSPYSSPIHTDRVRTHKLFKNLATHLGCPHLKLQVCTLAAMGNELRWTSLSRLKRKKGERYQEEAQGKARPIYNTKLLTTGSNISCMPDCHVLHTSYLFGLLNLVSIWSSMTPTTLSSQTQFHRQVPTALPPSGILLLFAPTYQQSQR